MQPYGNNSGDYAIIPMADYLNHGGAQTEASLDYDEDGNCYVYTTQNVAPGQSVRICYGDPTNPSKLLAQYGFLDESMPATFCKWIVEEPTEEIYNLGYPSQMLFYEDGSIANEVWDVVLYEELGKVSRQAQYYFYQAAHVDRDDDDAKKQEYHAQYFTQTHGVLAQHVQYILDELQELEMGLATQMDFGLNADRHPLPLLLRHNTFVKQTFERVQQNLNQMLS